MTNTIDSLRNSRRHSESGKDQREAFQRDRDRLLYSPEFRRLAGVTQVVHVDEGHVFHNRLTHSLKVAQIARRICEHLIKQTKKNLIDGAGGANPDVTETAALSHDIGHPPFGHIAEEELDGLLVSHGCNDGFEGNAQSFRILTRLSIRSSKNPGLNLTRATLNAVLKYPWPRGKKGKEKDKWGCYRSEMEDFEFARHIMAKGDKRKSLEAEIMDLADDVTYSVHDVDDFYRAGLIPFDQLLLETEERERFLSSVFARWKDEGQKGPTLKQAKKFFEYLRSLASRLTEPFHGSRDQRATLNFLSSFLLKRYAFGPKFSSTRVVVASGKSFLKIPDSLENEIKLLKEIMRYYVFDNTALLGQQYGQKQVIRGLFTNLFESANSEKSGHLILPHPFQSYLLEHRGDKPMTARIIADFIASITEQQAITLHRRLTGHAPGSVREMIAR